MGVLRRGFAVCGVAVLTAVNGVCAPASPAVEGGGVRLGAAALAVQWKDVPFQATQVIVRRGPSGVVETRGRVARNSDGSTYVELVDEVTKEPAEVLIFDVPHHRELVLNLKSRRYRVVAAPTLAGQKAPADFVSEQLRMAEAEKNSSVHRVRDGLDSTWKGLGVRQVAGLETVGSVQVVRPQAAPGETEDGPAEVDERWVSVDLGIAVLRVKHDPIRDEDTEMTLTAVMRSEPESALFAVPEGYVLEGAGEGAGRPK